MVSPMDDGGMGSLVLHPTGQPDPKREFGKTVYEFEFKDADRADALVSLNVDQQGMPFELDLWKTTFDPLVQWPSV